MSMMKLVTLMLLLSVVGATQAHHSINAHYDSNDVREVTGTVESVRWVNPHISVFFSAPNDQGEIVTWRAEGAPINTLERQGVSLSDLKPGDTITVIGLGSRFGRPEMIAAKLIHGDAEHILFPPVAATLFGSGRGATGESTVVRSAQGYEISVATAPDIFRVWVPVVFPATGEHPVPLPLTDSARAAAASYDPVADDLAAKCMPAGMPSMLDQPFPVEFVDEGDHILMRIEEWNGERTIYMDAAATRRDTPAIYGHSVGHWEGETLVIETSDIDYPYFDDRGTPMSADMRITERYGLNADHSRLEWTATMRDPPTFTEPHTFGGSMAFAPAIQLREFQCEPE